MGNRHDKEWLFTLARAMQKKADQEIPTFAESSPAIEYDEPSSNNRKPDYGLFVGILFGIATVFIFALQNNGFEVNWKWSILIYLVCSFFAGLTTLRHALPGRKPLVKYSATITLVLLCLTLGSIGTTKQYQKEHASPVSISPSQEENEEIAQLDNIFAGRDEIQLRQLYGFPEMLALNMDLNKARRKHYLETGISDMDMTPYTKNRQMSYDAEYAPKNLMKTPGSFVIIQDINVVSLLVLPQDYSANKAALLRYENSTHLPLAVIYAVKDFDRALQENTDLMQRAMNIAMREDPRLFLKHDDINSPEYFQVIESRYWTQFQQLRPLVDKIRDSIRDELEKQKPRQTAQTFKRPAPKRIQQRAG
jgi:hypothetical protein